MRLLSIVFIIIMSVSYESRRLVIPIVTSMVQRGAETLPIGKDDVTFVDVSYRIDEIGTFSVWVAVLVAEILSLISLAVTHFGTRTPDEGYRPVMTEEVFSKRNVNTVMWYSTAFVASLSQMIVVILVGQTNIFAVVLVFLTTAILYTLFAVTDAVNLPKTPNRKTSWIFFNIAIFTFLAMWVLILITILDQQNVPTFVYILVATQACSTTLIVLNLFYYHYFDAAYTQTSEPDYNAAYINYQTTYQVIEIASRLAFVLVIFVPAHSIFDRISSVSYAIDGTKIDF